MKNVGHRVIMTCLLLFDLSGEKELAVDIYWIHEQWSGMMSIAMDLEKRFWKRKPEQGIGMLGIGCLLYARTSLSCCIG